VRTPDVFALEDKGYAWVRDALSEKSLARLDDTCAMVSQVGERAAPGGELARCIGNLEELQSIAERFGYNRQPVRIVSFDKSREQNWALPWHQDRVIALAEKHDVEGYAKWGRKAGVWHCEPPVSLLEQMMFIRIHLDDADEENGCLEIAPCTHQKGVIPETETRALAEKTSIVQCKASRGDILLVKALVLHRSSLARKRAPRRAIRIDYSRADLPAELQWAFGARI